jgi:hypothetical protein
LRGGLGGAFSLRMRYLARRVRRVPDVRTGSEEGSARLTAALQPSAVSGEHRTIAMPPAHWMTRNCLGTFWDSSGAVRPGETLNAM